MDKIKVSILVPAYNVEAYLDECLQSLLSQTLKEIEIVVVDDGSSDRTTTIAEQYATSDSRVSFIRLPEHQGVSHARNVCLVEAQGEYLSFVDSDDTISSTAMEELYHKAKAMDADIVLGSMLYCYPDGRQVRVGDKSLFFRSDNEILSGQECFIRMQQTGCYVPMVCSNLYRTAFIKAHPQLHFEGEFHEDEYFTPFALYEATRVTDFKKDFYHYRQRTESIMHSCKNIKQRAESLCFVSKELKAFVKEQCEKIDNILRETFEQYSEHLSSRSQNLYEQELSHSKRKCLFIFSQYSVAANYGVGTYINQLVQCFDSTEWDVHVIILYGTSQELVFTIKGEAVYYTFPKPLSSYEERYDKSIFFYLASRIAIKRKVYCHFNFADNKTLAMLFKEHLQAVNVLTFHYSDWSFDLLGDKEWLSRIMANPVGKKDVRLMKAFEKEKTFMKECCDCVIAIARHSYQTLHEVYEIPSQKLVCIPNGLSDKHTEHTIEERISLRKKYGITEKEKLIIFAGRLDLVKGITELIKAFKEVRKVYPDTRLIIAGSGGFTACMEEASPDWKHITFIGFIPKKQLYELYAIVDIGVVPSIHEEFGYVAAEMMLNKLPIVVNNTTGLREITDNGKYAMSFHFDKERNIASLKEALLRALNTTCTEKQLFEAQKRILDNYSLLMFGTRMKETYNRLETPNGIINN